MDKLAESYATNSPMPDTDNLDKEKSKESKEKKKEKPEKKVKTLDEILEDATPENDTGTGTKILGKKGGFDKALENFESLDLSDVKDIPTGKMDVLPDGKRVNARWKSSDDRSTIEIQRPDGKRSLVKIRYEK
jgi:hypothetical protein